MLDLNRRSFLRVSAALGGGALLSAQPFGWTLDGGRAAAQTLADILSASAGAKKGLFGSVEIASKSFKALPQWARVLQNMEKELPEFRRCATDPGSCTSPPLKAWAEVIASAKGLPRKEQLHMVNKFFNRWPYKLDPELYGVSEYWASPTEFMRRSGDCEDYSIAKFFVLRELGFKSEELRIVILLDRIRNIGHAVLAYYSGAEILILDSLSDVILPHHKYRHYIPQYSMNETTRWAHVPG